MPFDLRMFAGPEEKMSKNNRKLVICLVACSTFLVTPGVGGDAPRAYVASPEVYQVIAQDDETKVILATWKPGQRDQWHSHPPRAEYFLTGCEARVHTPEGSYLDRDRKEGLAVLLGQVSSHSF
jgi:hypothetical protein